MHTPNHTIASPLSRKAVLVSVTISQWTARKLDKQVTDEVNRTHSATADAGRYNKLLIDAEHLKEIAGLVGEARRLHYSLTRPWLDEGPRILPNVLFHKFSDEFRVLKRKFEAAADAFARNYGQFIEQRKVKLNGLFKESDYPSVQEIRSKFNLDMNIMPLPDADDFRSTLDADTVEDIRAEIAANSAKTFDNAMQATHREIVEKVGHMASQLAAYANREEGSRVGTFRDTLVENVRELADLLPAFNFDNDPALDAITHRIKRELCVEDAQVLRDNPTVLENVQKSADDIVKSMQGMFA